MGEAYTVFSRDEQDLWMLYREATTSINAHLDACLKDEADVKLGDFYILLALVQAEQGEGFPVVRMGDLAARTNVSPSRLTYQTDVLERRGLIQKALVASDRRGRGIALTDAGRETYEVASKVYNREVQETVLRELTPENTGIFTPFLKGVVANISARQQKGR